MLANFIRTLAAIAGLVVVIPSILGMIVVGISRANKRLSVILGGFYGQILLGGLGVIIHELSHLIMALLFGHRIQSFSLLHIPNAYDPYDTGLGYVNHVWDDHNFYQKMGNVMIGIAPVIGCTTVMVLSTRWLVPDFYNQWLALTGAAPVENRPLVWWQLLVWLILMVNISVGGFDLSRADLQNSRQGLVVLLLLLVISAGICSFVTDYQSVITQLTVFLTPFWLAFGFAIVINLVLWGLLRLFVHVKGNY
ncbi:hypothetical protein [Limosilactobacillus caecicola]|uniref:hypothetical protein n=1 Tax=Limosilactobacillus caecicola TaxID=2941332 RepID=UPI00203A540B|nr:hypothetical protein [Limosilactobacillus caecicola]